MSAITDFAAKIEANDATLKAKLEAIATGVQSLDAKITALEGTLVGLTPEEQAALDQVSSESDALVAQANAINTADPTPVPAA